MDKDINILGWWAVLWLVLMLVAFIAPSVEEQCANANDPQLCQEAVTG